VEAFAELIRDLVDLVAPINLDGLPGGIEHHFAVAASSSMSANLFEQFGADLAIEVIGKLTEKVGAGHTD
jgi:hypothetical protein